MRPAQRMASFAGLMLTVAVALAASPGCSDYDDDSGYDRDRRGDSFDRRDDYYDDRSYRDRDRYDDDYDRRRYRDDDRDHGRDYDRDRDRDDDDRDDAVRIPRDANLVANGDDSLAYTAGQTGRVYVRDEKSGKVIYSGRVRQGQKVTVERGRSGVAVDGRTLKGGLDNKPRDREVFFRPDRGSQSESPRPKQPKKTLKPLPGKADSGKQPTSGDRVVP